ncbi:hypothetical protein C8Q75DRAFT_742876 [Abortiporus biennis]|nr:hypothetical protein C8Q75DRAFT_742876 [Abortiporus biennis]
MDYPRYVGTLNVAGNVFRCTRCRVSFPEYHNLREHHLSAHNSCLDCKRSFNDKHSLDRHLRTSLAHKTSFSHNAQKKVSCPMPSCSFQANNYSTLVEHLESSRCKSGVNKYWMDIRMANNEDFVDRPPLHLIGDVTKECSTVQVPDQSGKLIHMVQCRHCEPVKRFPNMKYFKYHWNSAAHRAVYRCPGHLNGCGNKFWTLSALIQHIEAGKCGSKVKGFDRMVRDVMQYLEDAKVNQDADALRTEGTFVDIGAETSACLVSGRLPKVGQSELKETRVSESSQWRKVSYGKKKVNDRSANSRR